MTDITDDEVELERRMRRNLFFSGPSRRASTFTQEEQAIADRLIGKHNVERLEARRPDGRRFRPVPVTITYEYWWVNGSQHSMGGWRMDRVENGRRTDHHYTGDIAVEINRLKVAGFTVKEIKIEGAPSLREPKRPTAGRKSFSERYGDFDPEVDD